MNKTDVVAFQHSLKSAQAVTFDNGQQTLLTPARWVPELANVPAVDLAGSWQVTYWPFVTDEMALAAGAGKEPDWKPIQQPGKVFYYDPGQSPDSIPNWNRVNQQHLDKDDGAIIRRRVEIPSSWAGKRILLRFEGIYPAGRIYWDGQPAAEQLSGLTPIEVDLTDRAKPGQSHLLAVRFFRRHDAIRLDMPRHALDFVGLHRSAFLHAVEAVHMSDVRLAPKLADDYASGRLQGEVTIVNTSDAPATTRLSAHISNAAGRLVASQAYPLTLPAGRELQVPLDLPAGKVALWNAEQPNLYRVTLCLDSLNQASQRIEQRIGWRRLEFIDGRPRLNGRPVKFRGVNHLTHHPEHGIYAPKEWLRQCLTLMKRANINAIRTHFLGPAELAELCDELGFYLLQELPIDWGTDFVQEPFLLGPMLHRMQAGVHRDRNHASLMVWSIGNENMPANEKTEPDFNLHLRLCNRLVKTTDPDRPTMFPPPGPANAIRGIFETRLGDIADIHYSFRLIRDLNETGKVAGNPRTWGPTFEPERTREELLTPNADGQAWNGSWFSSEYGINNTLSDLLNAPYTSIIADVDEDPASGKNSQQVFIDRLAREWGYMRDDERCLGGAYFCWIAAGAGDTWGWVRWGEDADWGVVNRDLTPKSMFWAMRILFSPVRIDPTADWTPGEKEIRLRIHNDYNSIDLSQCTLRTQIGAGKWMACLREWRDVPINLPPATSAEIRVPIWNAGALATLEKGQPIMMRCTVLDPTGYRPITVDVMVKAPALTAKPVETPMPIGPDAQ